MSFEGYIRYLCTNGHETVRDVYEDNPENCEFCQASFCWEQTIDETNGSYCSSSEYVDDEIIPCKGCEYCDGGRIDGYFDLIVVGTDEVVRDEDGELPLEQRYPEYRYLIPDLPKGYSEEQLEQYNRS